MKCSFCGNEVEKGMKYCPLCGAEVKEETPENQAPEMENHDEPNNDYSYGQSSSDPNADTAMDKMTVTLIAVLIMVESLVMDIVSLIMGSRRIRLVERHILSSRFL